MKTALALGLLLGVTAPAWAADQYDDRDLMRAYQVVRARGADDPNVPSGLCSGERMEYLARTNPQQFMEEWADCRAYVEQNARWPRRK